MTDQLRALLRQEVEHLDVPRPPIDAILAAGHRTSGVRRTRNLIAVAASVVLLAGGLVGVNRLLADDARNPSPDVATNSPNPSPNPSLSPSSSTSASPSPSSSETAVPGSLAVSGAGVGGQLFGADADTVDAAISARLGVPELVFGPREYSRIAGQDGWYDDPADNLSLSWQYRTMSASCWGQLCVIFGGSNVDSLKLRGWELAVWNRWSGSEVVADGSSFDVRLAGTGIRLGDTWKRLHAAYPETVPGGGEGASLVVNNTPWPGVFDGAGEWRLAGQWDYTRPTHAPPGAKVTRLSAGEGPEPGCC